jgi:hypothetical protein
VEKSAHNQRELRAMRYRGEDRTRTRGAMTLPLGKRTFVGLDVWRT